MLIGFLLLAGAGGLDFAALHGIGQTLPPSLGAAAFLLLFLGFGCSVMIILMGQGQHPKWFLASMVMFALPVLDTALAFARRWVAGRPPQACPN